LPLRINGGRESEKQRAGKKEYGHQNKPEFEQVVGGGKRNNTGRKVNFSWGQKKLVVKRNEEKVETEEWDRLGGKEKKNGTSRQKNGWWWWRDPYLRKGSKRVKRLGGKRRHQGGHRGGRKKGKQLRNQKTSRRQSDEAGGTTERA